MLCQLMLLVLLSSLQPGRLQEEGNDDTLFQNIHSNIVNLNSMIRSHVKSFEQFRAQMEESISSLTADLSSLNVSVSNVSACLHEHKEQTTAAAQQVNSRLDTLTTTQQCDSQQDSPIHTNITITSTDMSTLATPTPIATTPTTPTYTCGGTGGWRRAVHLDMTDPNTTCPSGWQLTGYSKRTCGKLIHGSLTCDSVTFPVSGGEYSRVCGRIKAYQWGGPDAFWSYHHERATSIDSAYVDGVTLTHGIPRFRTHIWTFAAGAAEGTHNADWVCPCDADHNIRIPSFVGNDYFCESGVNEAWSGGLHYTLHSNDPLWDGEHCLPSSTCCSLHNPPFFVKHLPASTNDDIEARICLLDGLAYDNIAVELVDLYVQ